MVSKLPIIFNRTRTTASISFTTDITAIVFRATYSVSSNWSARLKQSCQPWCAPLKVRSPLKVYSPFQSLKSTSCSGHGSSGHEIGRIFIYPSKPTLGGICALTTSAPASHCTISPLLKARLSGHALMFPLKISVRVVFLCVSLPLVSCVSCRYTGLPSTAVSLWVTIVTLSRLLSYPPPALLAIHVEWELPVCFAFSVPVYSRVLKTGQEPSVPAWVTRTRQLSTSPWIG